MRLLCCSTICFAMPRPRPCVATSEFGDVPSRAAMAPITGPPGSLVATTILEDYATLSESWFGIPADEVRPSRRAQRAR